MDDDNTINELALILVRVGRRNYSDDAKFEAQYENDSSDDLLMGSTLPSREMHPEHDPVDGRSEDRWASVDGGNVLPREAPIVYERRRSIEVREASFRENDPSSSYGAGNQLSGFSKYICKLRRKKRFEIVKRRRKEGKISSANCQPRYKRMQEHAISRERLNGRFCS